MRSFVALVAGLLFALGLGISGMSDPAKVISFLDVTGAWDPSLAFVMGGAIGVHFFAARWAARRQKPVLDSKFHLPKGTTVDAKLLTGAALFGIGWGIAGYCPGPALVAVAGFDRAPLTFVGAMVASMAAFHLGKAALTKQT